MLYRDTKPERVGRVCGRERSGEEQRLTFACDKSTSAGKSHLFPTSSLMASGHPLRVIELKYMVCNL